MKGMTLNTAVLAAAAFAIAAPALAGYNVSVDEFSVTKGGSLIYLDSFNDSTPPPNNPNPPFTYTVNGTVGPENSSGRLIMDQSGAALGTNSLGQTRAYQSVQLNTNAHPTTSSGDADYALGLKSWHDFTASVTFDYSVPSPGLVYGLRLADFSSTNPNSGSDTAFLMVYGGSGGPQVVFYQQNYLLGFQTVLDGTAVTASPFDQITLTLSHAAGSNQVSASWAYLLGGVLQGTGAFAPTATLFSDEPFTRASFMVSAPVPEPETWAMLLAGLGMLGFMSRRRLKV